MADKNKVKNPAPKDTKTVNDSKQKFNYIC